MTSIITDDVAVSLAPKDPARAKETSAGEPVGDTNPESNSFDQSVRITRARSDFTRLPPMQPFPLTPKDSSRFDEAPTREPARDRDVGRNSSDKSIGLARAPSPAAEQLSISRRIFRSVAGFLIMALTAVLTSIVVSSALQKLPPDVAIAAKQKDSTSASQVSIRDAVTSTSVAQKAPPVATAAKLESVQQLKAMAQDLTIVRQKLVQLTTAQQQMAQKIASLQALQQDIEQKKSSAPSSPAAVVPLRKNARTVAAAPRSILPDWRISHARNGYDYVQGHGKVYRVVPGTPLPGLGPVEQIKRQNGRWVVMTSKGIIGTTRDPESDDAYNFGSD